MTARRRIEADRLTSETMADLEEPLHGGLVDGRVWRVGNTVRRPSGDWTATIHALLAHLESKGFPAPRPMGLDEKGREILSWIPGHASVHPWPAILRSPEGSRQVGAMLKAYHQAVQDFRPPAPTWAHGAQALEPAEVALHGDFGPHNLVWLGDRLSGVIDFELARPGRPIEDAVFAALRVAHLRPDKQAAGPGFEAIPDRSALLGGFCRGYGCTPEEILAQACATQQAEIRRITELGGSGMEPWAAFLRRGLADEAREELAWLEGNLGALLAT